MGRHRSRTVSMLAAAAFAGASACTTSAGIEAPNPRTAAWRGPVLLSCGENGGSIELTGLPEDSLTSDVALLRADAEYACFDVKLRTWKGAAPKWNVSLRVDDVVRDEGPAWLAPCTVNSLGPYDHAPGPGVPLACVPEDSILRPRVTDALEAVQVRGERFCIWHGGALDTGTHDLALELRQGAFGFRFDFHLKDEVWSAARARLVTR